MSKSILVALLAAFTVPAVVMSQRELFGGSIIAKLHEIMEECRPILLSWNYPGV